MVHICSDENGGIYWKDTEGSQPLGGTSLEKSWELRGLQRPGSGSMQLECYPHPPTAEPHLQEAECTFPLSLAESGSLTQTLATREWERKSFPLKLSQLAAGSGS